MYRSKANTKNSYLVMKLDYMLDQYYDYGFIDLEELHTFISIFRNLPPRKQRQYSWMLDDAADLWDAVEQPME